MSYVEGKRVVLTGGARGIGKAVVYALTANGADVVFFDLLEEAGHQTAKDATLAGPGKAIFHYVDISKRADVFEAMTKAAEQLGGIDSLHNIAGVERRGFAEDISQEELDFILDVNVNGSIYTAQAAFPYMKDKGGTIINFGSDAGLSPYVHGLHYSASKGAVHSLTRTLAHEWAQYNIRVNAVIPAIWTEMYDEHRARLPIEQLNKLDETLKYRLPLGGKLGSPSEHLAPVMLFLTSDAASFITGQLIPVNGGLGSVR